MKILVSALCFLWLFKVYLAAKVVMLPLPSWPSHYFNAAKLGKELDRRGHEVIIFVMDGALDASKSDPFVKVVKTRMTKRDHDTSIFSGLSFPNHFHHLISMSKKQCDSFLSDEKALNELKTAQILIGDATYPCSSLVAAKFGIPHVSIVPVHLKGIVLGYYGISTYPSYVPQSFSGLTPNMGSLDRIKNFGFYLSRLVILEIAVHGFFSELKTKYNIKPEENIWKTLRTVDLLLVARDFVLQDAIMPLPPYVKEVGSFTPGPAKPLQPEWESFMTSSGDDGVILVTFGSVVDTLDNRIVATMNEAFSKLPQKVIWRLNTDKFEERLIASNIKTARWLPQNDILGHPKTKLFIGHGGTNGVNEAVYHGVPMICSPFFGDHFDNSRGVEYRGLGEILSVKTTTVDQLVAMINKVLTEKRYKEKAVYLSKVVKARPRTPVEEAAELIEYVHAVGNLAHLKPKGLELPFYQLYMLDVLLVLGVVFALVLFIVVFVIKRVINFCCCRQKKIKTS